MTTFRPRQFTSLIGVVTLCIVLQLPFPIRAQDAQPVFKAGVALVPITALVRDSRNRIVRNLGPDDFQVFEGGRLRPIVDFGANDKAPINVAFLLDTSGSMHVASNMARAKDFIEEFVGAIEPTADEVALFTFDKSLRREVSFTNDGDEVYDALDGVKPWGLTSLYDAVAETAKQLGDRTSQRRAVVVITDGVDTSSALTPAEVSGLGQQHRCPCLRRRRRLAARSSGGSDRGGRGQRQTAGSPMSQTGLEENCAMSVGPDRFLSLPRNCCG